MANEAQIQLAIESIQNGEQASIRSASTTYGVPKSVLHDRMTNKHAQALGKSKVLSDTTETLLVELIIKMSDIGFSLTQTELLELVTVYLNSTNQSHLFNQHRILWRSCEECDDWYCGDCFQLFLNDSFVCKKCS